MSDDAIVPEVWVETACAAAFGLSVSDETRTDMRRALEAVVPLAEQRATWSLLKAREETEGR